MGKRIKGFLMLLLMSMPLATTANDFNAGRQAARQHEAAPRQQSHAFDPEALEDYTPHPPQQNAYPEGNLQQAGQRAAQQSEAARSVASSAHKQGVCTQGRCPSGPSSDRLAALQRLLSGQAGHPMFGGTPRRCRTWHELTPHGWRRVSCCDGTESQGGHLGRGVYRCTGDEQQLRQARQAGRTVPVGSTCLRWSHHGGHAYCSKRRHTECVFNDALAAKLQRGAHAQLGTGFGSPASPHCQALTPHQLRLLDYDRLGLPSVTPPWRNRPDIASDELAGWRQGEAQLTGACAGGDCPHAQHEPDSDFGSAVSALKGAQASGRDLDGRGHLFPGRALQCREVTMGYSNCCQDHGWGQDLGLAQCSAEEKRLGHAKQAGRVVYLGRYCAHESDFGIGSKCWEHKRAYCVFPNQLAQIIQKQGREDQLGVSLGDAQHPDCRAITPEELQRMDFDAMDLSALTEQWRDELNDPDPGQIKQQLKQQMREQQHQRQPARRSGGAS